MGMDADTLKSIRAHTDPEEGYGHRHDVIRVRTVAD